jgi:hypothetical protein
MGQVNMNTGFGRFVAQIARDRADLLHFVEVGAWNGQGSTLCIAEGIVAREGEGGEGASLVSFEVDADMYAHARRYWEKCDIPFDFELVRGRISATMDDVEEVREAPGYEAHHEGWYEGEKSAFESAPFAATRMPPVVDFLLLDGGEYSTNSDWATAKKHFPKIVALDDVNMYKTRKIVEELEGSEEWVKIGGDEEERNGWAVYERI